MESPAVETVPGEPIPLYRKPSQESSPPPSPASRTSSLEGHDADPALKSQQTLPSFSAESLASSKPSTLDADASTTRPRHPGRQETPPSPPNSVLLNTRGEGRSPVTGDSSPRETMGAEVSKTAQDAETPNSSLMDRFSRAFRGHKRGSSENSWSTKGGYGRHKKDNSNSTNTTANPLSLTRIQTAASSKTSLQDEPDSAERLLFFSYSQDGSPVSPNSTGQGTGRGFGRRVMRGGEVRIEISQQQLPGIDDTTGNSDNSMKYYDYYTKSNASRQEIESASDNDGQAFQFTPSAARRQQGLARKPTVETESSSESRERRFVEDSMARRFEGFHFGVGSDGANSPTPPVPGLPRADSDTSSRPINADSRKPSSNVLSQMSQTGSSASRSQSSSTRNATIGSSSGRPGLNRGPSSSSFIIQGGRLSPQRGSPEELSQELKRLSKISAGSGVSGLAIVVTADGAASSHRTVDHDDDDSYEGPRWTREEKGKGRAASSEPGTHDQRSHSRSMSGRSAWTAGTEHTRTSDSNDDSQSLLPALPEIKQTRKLLSQEPSKDVLVQLADPRYEFSYRMRQTSDDEPILVPQYRYDVPFPNRNALSSPNFARPPKTADGNVYSSLGHRMSGSILRRPPSAILRSPVGTIPQGDDTYDLRPKTTPDQQRGSGMFLSKSYNDMDSLVHPALRASNKPRDVISMTSLEDFSSGLRGVSFTGERVDTAGTYRNKPTSEDGQRTTCSNNNNNNNNNNESNNKGNNESKNKSNNNNDRLRPPPEAQRSSWNSSRFLNQLPVRPREFMRRSLTPHLYNPQDIYIDQSKFDPTENRERQQKIGRMLLAVCLLFPPMWFVMAGGGFDPFVANWTRGSIRKVGSIEKRLALILATVVCLGAVIGVVVGVSIAATSGAHG
ncbi:hypothetical protein FN846DRAFT_53749 [Sphaerosporella brunnea]|uniref:Uncharacterized protein n=1 Tax=Sphaerosporella brunnea TaxID=1250544 RepID=A0A5J5EU50_9PEZI|nr:hypothetical protein FN846DRAFT_53749 [Sphaerosporella brunnea]